MSFPDATTSIGDATKRMAAATMSFAASRGLLSRRRYVSLSRLQGKSRQPWALLSRLSPESHQNGDCRHADGLIPGSHLLRRVTGAARRRPTDLVATGKPLDVEPMRMADATLRSSPAATSKADATKEMSCPARWRAKIRRPKGRVPASDRAPLLRHRHRLSNGGLPLPLRERAGVRGKLRRKPGLRVQGHRRATPRSLDGPGRFR